MFLEHFWLRLSGVHTSGLCSKNIALGARKCLRTLRGRPIGLPGRSAPAQFKKLEGHPTSPAQHRRTPSWTSSTSRRS
eukprot:3336843-Pyramimonas_sp.AAC.1